MTATAGYRPWAYHGTFSEPSSSYTDCRGMFTKSDSIISELADRNLPDLRIMYDDGRSLRREASGRASIRSIDSQRSFQNLGLGTSYRVEEPKSVRPKTPDCASVRSLDIHINTGTSKNLPPAKEHPEPIKEYGDQWEWDWDIQDYVRVDENGVTLYYTDYQKPAAKPSSPVPTNLVQRRIPSPVPDIPSYEEPLPDGFEVVAKPKKFFCKGRIFKTVWFEPSPPPSTNTTASTTTPKRQQSGSSLLAGEQWASKCPSFHGEKPVARYRWFVVLRRRTHYTLCFSITTFSGGTTTSTNSNSKNPAKTSRAGNNNKSVSSDHVVLHNAYVAPPRPYDEEGITRAPIAVIIEDEETYISPIARLDCGRVYTVEDGLATFKVGRVHPDYLDSLDEYYKESILR